MIVMLWRPPLRRIVWGGLTAALAAIAALLLLGYGVMRQTSAHVNARLSLMHAAAYGATIEDLYVLRSSPTFCRALLQTDSVNVDKRALIYVLASELQSLEDVHKGLSIEGTLVCEIAFTAGPGPAAFVLQQLTPAHGRAHHEAALLLMTMGVTKRDANLLLAMFADERLLTQERILEQYARCINDWKPPSKQLAIPLAELLDDILTRDEPHHASLTEGTYWGDGYVPYREVAHVLGSTFSDSPTNDHSPRVIAANIPFYITDLRCLSARWHTLRDNPPWQDARKRIVRTIRDNKDVSDRLHQLYISAISDSSFYELVDETYTNLASQADCDKD